MKKTRVLIPALAMIAFSTAASIAGSVAWFTASRQTTVNAGTYAVVKTTANLDCTVTGVLGTSASGNVVTVTDVLTDGSFNHKTGYIYQPNSSGTNFAETNPEVAYDDADVEEKLTRGQTSDSTPKTIYTAVMFELAFKINLGSANSDYGLFLDCYHHTNGGSEDPIATHEGSQFTCADAYLYTAPGFRMGFYSEDSGTKNTVFADLQDESREIESVNTTICKYIADDDHGFVGTAYVENDHDLIDKNYNVALPDEGVAANLAAARVDYLGKFAATNKDTNNDVTLTFTVVCWFEGTDPAIVNQDAANKYQSVAASLKFEAIRLGANSI